MDELTLIYEKLKNKYDLILTTTFAFNDGYTKDMPVIRGTTKRGRFDLYKESEDSDEFVFGVEFFDKTGDDKYSHGHPLNANHAIAYIEDFMANEPHSKKHTRK
ncbi:MAG: hypothetical protein IJW97_05185 [Clostridia bacterium]|jgi:hypothetical protein|nr:hypothetical protein [Clostridia bacterium]